MKTARILAPDVEPHDDPSRLIGRRTTYQPPVPSRRHRESARAAHA
jgi:hypothetical protein